MLILRNFLAILLIHQEGDMKDSQIQEISRTQDKEELKTKLFRSIKK